MIRRIIDWLTGRNHGPHYEANAHLGELVKAVRWVEDKLGRNLRFRRVSMELRPGLILHSFGEWSGRDEWGRRLGGYCQRIARGYYRIVLFADPKTLMPPPKYVRHEVMHAALYEQGIPETKHHKIMSGYGL